MTPTGLRHRLSAHDSVFLYWERPEQPMHVGECMVYRGSITAADILKLHHAMVDGVSSIELIEVLHSPVGGDRPPSSEPPPRPSPGTIDLVRDAVADRLGAVLDRAGGAVDLLRPGGPRRLLERLGPL